MCIFSLIAFISQKKLYCVIRVIIFWLKREKMATKNLISIWIATKNVIHVTNWLQNRRNAIFENLFQVLCKKTDDTTIKLSIVIWKNIGWNISIFKWFISINILILSSIILKLLLHITTKLFVSRFYNLLFLFCAYIYSSHTNIHKIAKINLVCQKT